MDPATGLPYPFTSAPNDFWELGPFGDPCWQTGVYTFNSPIPGLVANTWRANTPNP